MKKKENIKFLSFIIQLHVDLLRQGIADCLNSYLHLQPTVRYF